MQTYPILSEDSTVTDISGRPVCPLCYAHFSKIGFVLLSAGALQVDENNNGVYGEEAVSRSAYFDINSHMPTAKPLENNDVEWEWLPIVKFPRFGEFSFSFCSIDCLRKWLNGILDDFEHLRDLNKKTNSRCVDLSKIHVDDQGNFIRAND